MRVASDDAPIVGIGAGITEIVEHAAADGLKVVTAVGIRDMGVFMGHAIYGTSWVQSRN